MSARPAPSPHAGVLVLIAVSILSMVLGSIHAFSVFLEPLESQFQTSRSHISLTYSLGLVFLTFAVLLGHRVYGLVQDVWFVAGVCILGALGAGFSAIVSSSYLVWLGYGVLFGLANGLGYGFGLQFAAQANAKRTGFAMGVVTACYALGAALSPPLFDLALNWGGFSAAMMGLALVLLAIMPICCGLLSVAGIRFQNNPAKSREDEINGAEIVWLWCAYGAAVAAGLMSIGHAAGILKTAGWHSALWIAPVVIAVCNMAGSLMGGWLVDRFPAKHILATLSGLSAMALGLMILSNNSLAVLIGLGSVGFCYGALIASYPAVILKRYGQRSSAKVYGRVFTAWGFFGLFGPLLAALLFDMSGTYTMALLVAVILSLASILVVTVFLPHPAGKG